MSTQTERKDLF